MFTAFPVSFLPRGSVQSQRTEGSGGVGQRPLCAVSHWAISHVSVEPSTGSQTESGDVIEDLKGWNIYK